VTVTPRAATDATLLAAVGVPYGVLLDPDSAVATGMVRIGGALRSLPVDTYAVWASLLFPMTTANLTEVVGSSTSSSTDVLADLERDGLVVRIEPGTSPDPTVGQLRALPLGASLGNQRDPARFDVASSPFVDASVDLGPVETLFWFQLDGTRSLTDCADAVARQVPDLRPTIGELAMKTVLRFMSHRLIYLDTPAPG
jgi:hypothetical protein